MISSDFIRIKPTYRTDEEKVRVSFFESTNKQVKVLIFFNSKLEEKLDLHTSDKLYVTYHAKNRLRFMIKKSQEKEPGLPIILGATSNIFCFNWDGGYVPPSWLKSDSMKVTCELKNNSLILDLKR